MHIILDNSLYNSGQKPRQVVKEKGTGLYFLHFQLSWVLSFVNKEASLSAVAPFKRILWICEKRFIRNCIEKGVSDIRCSVDKFVDLHKREIMGKMRQHETN